MKEKDKIFFHIAQTTNISNIYLYICYFLQHNDLDQNPIISRNVVMIKAHFEQRCLDAHIYMNANKLMQNLIAD